MSDLAKAEERLAYLLLLPTLVILFLIAIYPLGSVFYYSTTDRRFASSQATEFVGLDNYQQLLNMTVRELPRQLDEAGQPAVDPDTGEALYARPNEVLITDDGPRYRDVTTFNLLGKRYVLGATDRDFIDATLATIIFTVLSVVLETVLGLGVAMVVNSNFAGRGPLRVLMLLPWAIPTAVSSRMWEFMFDPTRRGFFNVVSQKLGLTDGQVSWLTERAFQLPAMIAIDVWKTTPFMALLLLAGLQLIPSDIYEAADVDGASKFRQFWQLTLPLLRPTMAVALIFRTLDAVRVFDLFQIVLAEKRYSMASFAYYELIKNQKMGYASAASVIIFLLIFIFAVVYMRALGVSDEQ
ncbi:MAG: sugar ABC transporter permease [Ardenticatenales bacterium]|nr:sugar ABC transporter permease [Ardenticatenales bacterium]